MNYDTQEDEDVFGAPVPKPGPPTIVVAGPLASQICDALNNQYKKQVDEETGIVLETGTTPDAYRDKNTKLLFCAMSERAGVGDLLALTGKLSQMGDGVAMRASVIIDGASRKNKKALPVLESIRALCKRKHVPIYNTVGDYLRNAK